MPPTLDRTARRIIGVLIEKQLTTPQGYPLSVHAVMAGCAQKNNRDPVLDFREFEIENALSTLYLEGWVSNVSQPGARVLKWKHRADERLAVSGAALAIVAELLLRGAQPPGALRVNAGRMVAIPTLEDLEREVAQLAGRKLVQSVRRPGERAPRWDHCLYPEGESAAAPAPAASARTLGAGVPDATRPAADDQTSSRLDALESRLLDLEIRLRQIESADRTERD